MRTRTLLLGAFAALIALGLDPSVAKSSTGPTTPTFLLAWGSPGAGATQFNVPSGVATDNVGNVYVADASNHRIQKFDRLGIFITEWGSNGSGNGQFGQAVGVTTDAAGNVYVADQDNHRIQKFTDTGTYLTQWGSFGSGDGQFSSPAGAATDAAGNVYVVDKFNHRIQKFTGTGTYLDKWGSSGSGNGQFNYPNGVATDAAGNVYVADTFNHRIQKFTSTGTYLTQWGSNGTGNGQFSYANGVATDATGNLYVADANNHRIQKFTNTGAFITQWGSNGGGNGQFNFPYGLTTDAAGNVYVADAYNHRIQKFSGAGASLPPPAPPSFLLSWGTSGSGDGQFSHPAGVAIDAAGNIYVPDQENHRVQKFTGGGVFLTQWGSLGSGNAQFNFPTDVAIDATGNVYVVDNVNHRVQKFTSEGLYLTQWGSNGSGDGQFSGPHGVATDAAGNVYVTDLGNSRIQKFTDVGGYLAQWGSFGEADGQFFFPAGVAADAAGNVYVVDANIERVQKFTAAGAYLTQWGSTGTGDGKFKRPWKLATDAAGNVYVADRNNGRIQKFTGAGAYLTQWGVTSPEGIATDAAGNVFVADVPNNRIRKFVAPPAIALVSDVGNDQGRQVRLRILRVPADAAGSGATITGYAVYRRIDPLSNAAEVASADEALRPEVQRVTTRPAEPARIALAGWDFVTTVPTRGDAEYNVVVPTLADANASTSYYTAFFVSALTQDPYVYFDSPTEYGYSIDNLSPPAPTPFAAAYATGETHLHWGISGATDFFGFRLYRGANAGFIPEVGNLVAATADTGYVDAGPAGGYYKLSAVDFNGNESSFALVSPGGTTGVPGSDVSGSVELAGAFPNPIHVGGTVRYALPGAMPMSLALYDVAGRRVRELVDGLRPAGAGSVQWDGRDDAGHALPSGLLILRLAANGRVLTRRVVTLE